MISIITTYYNRRKQFLNTIDSILKSDINNFELIVVDDGSDSEHSLSDLNYPFLKLIEIDEKDKWWENPCVPFNIGIKEAVGDIIVLQNPECYHVGDVLKYINDNINNDNYLSISTYSFSDELTDKIKDIDLNIEYLNTLPIKLSGYNLGWYNHSIHRPLYYHFCSAIKKSNMDKLGGFDERYAQGITYDDDEFLMRVRRLGLDVKIIDDVSVIHQYHEKFFYKGNYKELHLKNKKIFEDITRKEKIIKVNEK